MRRDSNRDCSFLRISIANGFRTFRRRNRKLLLRKARKRPQGGEPERRKFSLVLSIIEWETCEESNFRSGSNNGNYSFWWLLTDHNRFSPSAHVLVPPVMWTSAGSFGIPMRNESSLGLLITIAWSEWRWIDSNEQIMTKSWLWRRELYLAVTRWIMRLSVRKLLASFFVFLEILKKFLLLFKSMSSTTHLFAHKCQQPWISYQKQFVPVVSWQCNYRYSMRGDESFVCSG